MHSSESDHYAKLGLDRRCTLAQIRAKSDISISKDALTRKQEQ